MAPIQVAVRFVVFASDKDNDLKCLRERLEKATSSIDVMSSEFPVVKKLQPLGVGAKKEEVTFLTRGKTKRASLKSREACRALGTCSVHFEAHLANHFVYVS